MRKPELELEQAAEVLSEVDVMMIDDDVKDADLIAAVANTRHELVEAENLMGLMCHCSTIWLLKEHHKTRREGDTACHIATPSMYLVGQQTEFHATTLAVHQQLKELCQGALAHARIRVARHVPTCPSSITHNTTSLDRDNAQA